MQKKIKCPFCLEKFEVIFDEEEKEGDVLIIDCEICCHPIDVMVSRDPETGKVRLLVDRSSGF